MSVVVVNVVVDNVVGDVDVSGRCVDVDIVDSVGEVFEVVNVVVANVVGVVVGSSLCVDDNMIVVGDDVETVDGVTCGASVVFDGCNVDKEVEVAGEDVDVFIVTEAVVPVVASVVVVVVEVNDVVGTSVESADKIVDCCSDVDVDVNVVVEI